MYKKTLKLNNFKKLTQADNNFAPTQTPPSSERLALTNVNYLKHVVM